MFYIFISFSATSSELFFSFLEEFARVFLKDNLVVFNLILKVSCCIFLLEVFALVFLKDNLVVYNLILTVSG